MSDLWCVHVYGPDDLHAAADRDEAIKIAADMGAAWDRAGVAVGWPQLFAVAEAWPYDAESHAADLANRLADPKEYWS